MSYAREADDPDVLSPREEGALLVGAPWRRFAVLGDSIAEGIGDPVPGYDDLSWSERIARALGRAHPDLAYLNLGRRHLKAAEVRASQLEPGLAFGPDLVVVYSGGNDILVPDYDPLALRGELEATIAPFAEIGATVVLGTLFEITGAIEIPEPHRSQLQERQAALRDLTRALAADRGALLVDFASHGRGADPTIYSADMLHLNRRGHAVVGSVIIAALAESLDRAATPSS
jgi:lysophospholipase L1-like esterase